VAGSTPVSATAEPARPLERREAALTLPPVLGSGAALASGLLLALALVAVAADRLAPSGPFATVGPPLAPPSGTHPFGTDDLGRDLLAGVAHGTRTSLLVVGAVGFLTLGIGIPVGLLAGYHGGRTDEVLMRAAELVQVVPRFFLAVVVAALFGPGLDRIVLVLGLTSWPATARVVRAETLSVEARAFVEAARALGAAPRRILTRHVLPAVLPPAIVVLSLTAAGIVLLEASLAFLGLGDPAWMSLGYLANNAQRFLRVAWWMAVFPGAAIAATVLALNLGADVVNDWLDPRRGLRRRVPTVLGPGRDVPDRGSP
jgi:peptide/nickel transport system permease protein